MLRISPVTWEARMLRITPVTEEQIMNYVTERALKLPKSY